MKFNVMVFPCGAVNAIDINTALKDAMLVNLYGGSSVSDHGEYVFRNYIGNIPNILEEDFINEFNKVIDKNNIDFIIPTHDTVAMFLSKNQSIINAKIVTSEYRVNEICRYKKKTYDVFKDYDFNPKVYKDICEIDEYPIYLKPNVGSGGQACLRCDTKEELIYRLKKNNDLIICEYLPGEELSIDCFTDRHGKLIFVGPRSRVRTFNGISARSSNIELNEEIKIIADEINKKISLKGYWFFQVKRNKNGRYKLLEISTRMAGTACLNRNLDINFPLLSILDMAGYNIDIIPNKYNIELDRTLISRYSIDYDYEIVYIDLDDTLILENKNVNTILMMFLYQCKNKNIDLILITKHIHDVNETLEKYSIDKSLFKEIIKVVFEQEKYKYFNKTRKSIFIDNSFYERKIVKQKLGVPTFDVSNIECLIDWRG